LSAGVLHRQFEGIILPDGNGSLASGRISASYDHQFHHLLLSSKMTVRRRRRRYCAQPALISESLERRLVLNAQPTLDPISDVVVVEDADPASIGLSGISAGAMEIQDVSISVSSSRPDIVTASVTYTSPSPTAQLTLSPQADRSGIALISVTVEDAGPDNNLSTREDNAFLTREFAVTVGESYELAATTAYVDARSDLFSAGKSSNPEQNRWVPWEMELPPGRDRWLDFTAPAGLARGGPTWNVTGPFGGTLNPQNQFTGTNIFSENGISGLIAPRHLFVSGVFLNDSLPDQNATPERLDFVQQGIEFRELSPSLQQSFFIGHGANSDGFLHRYQIPDDATRLFLGFIDGVGFGWAAGGRSPAAYHDNQGILSLKANITVNGDNDSPTIDDPGIFAVPRNSPGSTLSLSGITSGPEEQQPVRVEAMTLDNHLISSVAVSADGTNGTGELTVTPVAGQTGTATVTVTVEDGGFDYDLSTTADNATTTLHIVVDIVSTQATIVQPGTSSATSRPMFVWTAIPEASSYDLWVNHATTGNAGFIQESVTTTSWQPAEDIPLGVIDAWVRARSATGTPYVWSPINRTAIRSPPQIHQNDVDFSTVWPTLTWDAISGATDYEVWIDNRTTGQSGFIQERTEGNSQWTPTTGMELGEYSLWVRARDAIDAPTLWSQSVSFSIVAAPSVTGPAAATFDRQPEFSWAALPGDPSTRIFLQKSDNGNVVADVTVPGTSWTPSAALADGDYRWWIQARTDAGFTGNWSQVQHVHVGGRPSITGPSGSTSSDSVVIAWTTVDGAARYELWIDRLDIFESAIIHETQLSTTQFDATGALPAGGNYRVWVRAISSTGEIGPWSRAADFTIQP